MGVVPEQRTDGFSRFAWGVLVYILLVVLWGAYVRAAGSGAGCGGHWPLCNGEIVPQSPAAATIIEYSHRVSSGLALVAVTLLCVWAFRRALDRIRRGGGAAGHGVGAPTESRIIQ
jgi:heme A synthase